MKHELTPKEVELIRTHIAVCNDIDTNEVTDEKVFYYIEDSTEKEVRDFVESLAYESKIDLARKEEL